MAQIYTVSITLGGAAIAETIRRAVLGSQKAAFLVVTRNQLISYGCFCYIMPQSIRHNYSVCPSFIRNKAVGDCHPVQCATLIAPYAGWRNLTLLPVTSHISSSRL